jgi:putative endonuclease
MFYVYVIRSLKTNFVYKGHCEDLEKRLQQHNAGMTESIRPYIPFELIYFEKYDTREEAIKREKYFKTAAGRRFLKLKI